ncbi:MAG: CoA transferase [Acidimicrobiales bacterium]
MTATNGTDRPPYGAPTRGATPCGWLADLTVLDLADERAEVGGHILADLGAAVIRVDGPGGLADFSTDPVRFAAYNANKRAVTLDGEPGDPAAAVDHLARLVTDADIVIESRPGGILADRGLDHDWVRGHNPTVVHVVVTPFGIDGPRAQQPASELTLAALGGPVWLQGERAQTPLHFSIPQVWRHAGAEAAGAALMGLAEQERSGGPVLVDLSAQAVMTWTLLNAMEAHAIQGREFQRNGSILDLSMPIQLRQTTTDGYVIAVPTARTAGPLHPWLIEEGIVDPSWADIDWATFDHRFISGEPTEVTMTEVADAVAELCRRHPKDELYRRGLGHGATLAPLNNVIDLLAFDHLAARGYWSTGDDRGHDRDGGPLRHPGAPWILDEQRPAVNRAAPHPERRDPPGRTGSAGATAPDADPTAPPARHRAWTRSGDEADDLPLSGLRVLDFSWIGVGPITAKALADHGATVIRVESETRIDGLRRQPPYFEDEPGDDRSHFFGTFNTSKLGLALDLARPEGRDLAHRLADWADVVIESFTPGTIGRIGLGYDQLASEHPELIMVSTSLLGPGSEVSCTAGYGYHAAALAGFQDLVGEPGEPPDGPWLAYTDTIGPRFLVPAVLAALRERDRTGRGAHIDGAQLEIALQLLAPELMRHQLDGSVPPRAGNRHPTFAPQGVYPVAGDDRWLALTVTDDGAWNRLVEALGRPAWATDPALATAAGRHTAHDDLDRHLAAWTAGRDGRELEALLTAAGVAAGLVQTSADLAVDAQYTHRDFFRVLDHSAVGPVPYAGHQFRIGATGNGPRFASPCLGEHTWQVLTEILGLSDDEAAEIAATGILV